MPSFRIEEVPDGYNFKEYASVMMKSFTTPRQPSWNFVFPIKDSSPEAFEEGVENASKRLSSEHSSSSNLHYVQVMDDDNNGAIVAGAGFHIHENNDTNPYTKKSPIHQSSMQ